MVRIRISGKAQIMCIWAFLVAFVWGCANVVTPSGGPKDKAPPKVEESIPKNGQTDFEGDEIILSFNEFFKLNNPSQEIYFSPPLPEKPDYNIRQKSLQIQLPDKSLQDSTTYTITFGKGIQDITEGNAAKDLTLTFSTGPVIDTFRLGGRVEDAFTAKPEENTWVGLYKSLQDSVPDKKKPQYVTRTDENGQYRFDHLPQSTFYIFALQDNNRNLRYDLPNEKMAFRSVPVESEQLDTLPKIPLRLFQKEPPRISQVSNKSPVKGKLVVNYSNEIERFSSQLVKKDVAKQTTTKREGTLPSDSVAFWFHPIPDSAFQFVTIANDTVRDTVRVQFSQRNTLPDKLTLEEQNQQRGERKEVSWASNEVYQSFGLSFSYPIDTLVKDKVHLFRDSTERLAATAYSIDKNQLRQVSIKHTWEDTTRYFLKLEKGAIQSIYNQSSDTIVKYFRTTKQEDYSEITLQFDNVDPANHYIVQLYKREDNIQREVSFQGDQQNGLTIKHLRPQTYKLRVIVDQNNNERWDPGNYSRDKQPEQVIYYKGKIEVRKNWENEIKVEL